MSTKVFYACFSCNSESPCILSGLENDEAKPKVCPLGSNPSNWKTFSSIEDIKYSDEDEDEDDEDEDEDEDDIYEYNYEKEEALKEQRADEELQRRKDESKY